MTESIHTKYAVVTGASTGIGRAIAIELAKQGVVVALVARTKERLEETKRLIVSAGGGKTEIIVGDLSQTSTIIEDLTKGLAEELKEKDIQVNCVSPSDTATEEYKKYFPQYIDEANSPEDIAKQVSFLCSEKADEISGSVVIVKKGQKPFNNFHF